MSQAVRRAKLMWTGFWIAALKGLSRFLFVLGWLPLNIGRFFLWLADVIDAGSDSLAAHASALAEAEPSTAPSRRQGGER